ELLALESHEQRVWCQVSGVSGDRGKLELGGCGHAERGAHLITRPSPSDRQTVRPSDHSVRPQAAHHFALVERLLGGADDLIRLMPFSGEQDRVPLTRELERLTDRGAAIDDAIVLTTRHPGFDVVMNLLWILGARVVGRHNRDVVQAHGDLARSGSYATVGVTACAHDYVQ